MEMVQHGIFDYLQISFVITGHTKFDIDHLFSVTAKSYNSAYVFKHSRISSNFGAVWKYHCCVRGWSLILNWREKVAVKYSKLPGIYDLHYFIIVRSPDTGSATMLVHDHCYGGSACKSTMKLNSDVSSESSAIPCEDENYHHTKQNKEFNSNQTNTNEYTRRSMDGL